VLGGAGMKPGRGLGIMAPSLWLAELLAVKLCPHLPPKGGHLQQMRVQVGVLGVVLEGAVRPSRHGWAGCCRAWRAASFRACVRGYW